MAGDSSLAMVRYLHFNARIAEQLRPWHFAGWRRGGLGGVAGNDRTEDFSVDFVSCSITALSLKVEMARPHRFRTPSTLISLHETTLR